MRLSNIIRPLILGGGTSDGVAVAVVLEVGTDVSVLLLVRGIRVATGGGNNTCRWMALIVVAIHTIRATMGAASWKRKIPAVPGNSDEVVVLDAAAAAATVLLPLLLPPPIVVVLKASAAIPDELDDDDEYMLVVE